MRLFRSSRYVISAGASTGMASGLLCMPWDALMPQRVPKQQIDTVFVQQLPGLAAVLGLEYVGEAHELEHGANHAAHALHVFYH